MNMRSAEAQGEPTPMAEALGEDVAHKPDGPLSAALIAAGIGIFVLGVFTTLSEANEDVADFLNLHDPVGPLAGKTVFSVAIWLIAWVVAGVLYRGRDDTLRTALIIFVVLSALGYLGTFPTFFQAFE